MPCLFGATAFAKRMSVLEISEDFLAEKPAAGRAIPVEACGPIEACGDVLFLRNVREAAFPVQLSHIFAFLLMFGCFYGLGSYGLLDDMEGLYAAIARDMLQSGNYLIPHLNGVSYLEKPPMLYWLMAFSLNMFGENEFAARLPVATATAFLAIAIVWFLRSQNRAKAGMIAGIIMVTSPTLLIIGRYIYCDMLLAFFTTMALMAFYRWYQENDRKWLMLCHGMIALAVLTKGVIALILTGGTVFCFLLAKHDKKRMLLAFDPLAVGIFFLIAAPWHMAAMIREEDFAWFYFVGEHVLRFLGSREPHDYPTGPTWYYLPCIVLYIFPWSLLIGALLWRLRKEKTSIGADERMLRQFLWIWFCVVFVFFSLSKAKSYNFMAMGLPPLIMLAGLQIVAWQEAGHEVLIQHFAWRTVLLSLVIMVGTLLYFPIFRSEVVRFPDASYWLLLLPGLFAAIYGFKHRWSFSALEACVLPLCMPILVFLPSAIGGLERTEQPLSQKQPALYLLEKTNGDTIALYHDFDILSALAFYLPKPLAVIDSTSPDLAYGVKHGQRSELFPSLLEWVKNNEGKPVYLVARTRYVPELMQKFENLPANEKLCLNKQFVRVAIFSHCRLE